MNVGVVGLGVLGEAIAGHLARAGFVVVGLILSKKPATASWLRTVRRPSLLSRSWIGAP
jgi:3-hydroxyisobutyrate dehydrogenase-like beta-hydroxyacid dehydrogenase